MYSTRDVCTELRVVRLKLKYPTRAQKLPPSASNLRAPAPPPPLLIAVNSTPLRASLPSPAPSTPLLLLVPR